MIRHRLTTEVDIPAEPREVWRHLIALEDYPGWNPFITSATGTPAPGARLDLRIEPPGGRPMIFRPRVTVIEPDVAFEWLGHLGVPGIFDGRHRFDLTATATGTRLTHGEAFQGILVPFLRSSLDRNTRAGFEAMNRALAERVGGS